MTCVGFQPSKLDQLTRSFYYNQHDRTKEYERAEALLNYTACHDAMDYETALTQQMHLHTETHDCVLGIAATSRSLTVLRAVINIVRTLYRPECNFISYDAAQLVLTLLQRTCSVFAREPCDQTSGRSEREHLFVLDLCAHLCSVFPSITSTLVASPSVLINALALLHDYLAMRAESAVLASMCTRFALLGIAIFEEFSGGIESSKRRALNSDDSTRLFDLTWAIFARRHGVNVEMTPLCNAAVRLMLVLSGTTPLNPLVSVLPSKCSAIVATLCDAKLSVTSVAALCTSAGESEARSTIARLHIGVRLLVVLTKRDGDVAHALFGHHLRQLVEAAQLALVEESATVLDAWPELKRDYASFQFRLLSLLALLCKPRGNSLDSSDAPALEYIVSQPALVRWLALSLSTFVESSSFERLSAASDVDSTFLYDLTLLLTRLLTSTVTQTRTIREGNKRLAAALAQLFVKASRHTPLPIERGVDRCALPFRELLHLFTLLLQNTSPSETLRRFVRGLTENLKRIDLIPFFGFTSDMVLYGEVARLNAVLSH